MKFMSSVYLFALAALPLAAQSATTTTFLSASSTGMMGLAATQTAQLNVVNLSAAATTANTTTIAPCEVQLEFWDATGKMIKSTTIANLAPGAAGSFSIRLADVATSTSTLRTEVRGVVRTSPLTTSGSGVAIPIAYPLNCSVATTMEIFDNGTGVTQSSTSDLRALSGGVVVPLLRP